MDDSDAKVEACRSWWRNCAVVVDDEILAIDRFEDAISPVLPGIARIRELISTLELCHHKAERWVDNIVAAIAFGDTEKGLGTRPTGEKHPAEETWTIVCTVLEAKRSSDRPRDLADADELTKINRSIDQQ